MKKLLVVLLFLNVCSPALAKKDAKVKSKNAANEVEKVLSRYRQAPAIKAQVRKTVIQEMMGKETKSEGVFYFSKGKLRMEILQPEVSTLVYDGSSVWFESRFDEQNIQVTHVRANLLKKSDSLLAAVFDNKGILKTFNLKKHERTGDRMTFRFEPKDKKSSDVQSLKIVLLKADLRLLEYTDSLENKVIIEFENLKTESVSAAKFRYSPPKKADVTEL